MKLSELKIWDSAYIKNIEGNGAFKKRINEMGFIIGEKIETVKKAPLRDPVEYKIMGYNVSIRLNEAGMIHITQEKPDLSVLLNIKETHSYLVNRIIDQNNNNIAG